MISTIIQIEAIIMIGHKIQKESSEAQIRKQLNKQRSIGIVSARGKNPVQMLRIKKQKKIVEVKIVNRLLHNTEHIIIHMLHIIHGVSGAEVIQTNMIYMEIGIDV